MAAYEDASSFMFCEALKRKILYSLGLNERAILFRFSMIGCCPVFFKVYVAGNI